MKTYYLIDFENVGGDGLSGCNKLTEFDHIIIFFTSNAKKIDMSDIADHGQASFEMIEVPSGKQSTDIHIGSYLGYLAGANKSNDFNCVIISKDTDFDKLIMFWKNRAQISLLRRQTISTKTEKQNRNTKMNADDDSEDKKTKTDSNKKCELNVAVRQTLRSAGFNADVSNKVAQLVTNLYGKSDLKAEVHNVLQNNYENYLKIYNELKSVLAEYSGDKNTPSPAENAKEKIAEILNKAGFESEKVEYVSLIVKEKYGVKNGKQEIYRSIISKYGQKNGLEVYNYIKKSI